MNPRRAWLAAAAALGALAVAHAYFSAFNHDEIQHAHDAWRVATGGRPFVDFCEQHHPTYWYLVAPLARIFSTVRGLVFALRLVDLACLAVALAAVARVVRRLDPAVDARWPVLLLGASFLFVRNMIEVRPDPLMTALLLVGLALWLEVLDGAGGRARAILAGLCLGAAVAALQKALVVVALVGLGSAVVIALRAGERRRLARLSAWASLAAALPVATLFAVERLAGDWRAFWFWNYTFNSFFYLTSATTLAFSALRPLGESFVEDPLLWVLAAIGLARVAREAWHRRETSSRLVIAVAALGYLAFLARTKMPFNQYLIPLLPLVALLAAPGFARPSRWLRAATLALALVCAVRLAVEPSSAPQRAVQDYVLAHTSPDETVFVPPPLHPVFRRDAGFFWYDATLIRDTYVACCRVRADCPRGVDATDSLMWMSQPPEYVYLHPKYREYAPPEWMRFAGSYAATEIPGLDVRR